VSNTPEATVAVVVERPAGVASAVVTRGQREALMTGRHLVIEAVGAALVGPLPRLGYSFASDETYPDGVPRVVCGDGVVKF
jgi:hypothetical protein